MSTLSCIETYKDKEQNIYGCFLIEPLEVGQGITLGNALRRTLLSDLTSLAITGIRVNNLKHEFASIQGIREDVLEIILNLKEIVFKNSFHSKTLENVDFSRCQFLSDLHIYMYVFFCICFFVFLIFAFIVFFNF
jgi:DNA-directed RNA polymerase subunit alpha